MWICDFIKKLESRNFEIQTLMNITKAKTKGS